MIDPFEYIKFPERNNRTTESIKLLFSDKAKFIAKPFLIGKQKQLFYGQFLTMRLYSDLIATIPNWDTSEPIELATNIELTEDNLPGLIVVWLLINGLYPFTLDKYNLKDTLIIWEWIDYFGYNNRNIIDTIRQNIITRDELFNETLSELTKPLMEKRYNQQLKICLADPISFEGTSQCELALAYATVAEIKNEETELMRMYLYDDDDFIDYLRKMGKSPNEIQLKWANFMLDYLIRQYKGGGTLDDKLIDRLDFLGNFTGRLGPTESVDCILFGECE